MDLKEVREIRDDALQYFRDSVVNFEKLINALDMMELSMLRWIDGTTSKDSHEQWQIIQFCRAIEVFRSCRILISQGSPTDALALSRTILDIYIFTSWVKVNGSKPFDSINKNIIIQKYHAAVRKSKKGGILSQEQKELLSLSKPPKKDVSIAKMADDQYVNLGDLYDKFFNISSAYLHSQGNELGLRAAEQGKNVVEPSALPSSDNLEIAWLATYTIMKRYWISAGELFQKNIDFKWDVMEYWRIYLSRKFDYKIISAIARQDTKKEN